MTALKTALFSILVPGSVGGLVPWLMARSEHAHLAAGSWVLRVACAVPLAVGLAGYLWCAADFVTRGGGTPAPIDPPRRLVTDGLYRYSRNPMYVSVLLAIAGWSLLFGSVTILVYGIAVFAAFQAFIVLYEEPKLTSLFGDEYTAYCARVRRWGFGRPSRR